MELAVGHERILSAGTVLDGRFQLLSHIASGSFGAVYRAEQVVAGQRLRLVALKILKMDASESSLFTMFNDAMTLLRIQDEKPDIEVAKHLVKVLDMGVLKTPFGPRPFISMELVRGSRTLRHYIALAKRGGLVVEMALDLVKQILRPLAWMHSLDPGIIHGDLKPENILADDNQLILTDFGLSAPDVIGIHGGTLHYMAPEELSGALVPGTWNGGGAASDVYSVGLMLYEMLTGINPFEDAGADLLANGNESALTNAQYAARKWELMPQSPTSDNYIPSLSSLNPETREYPALESIVRKALAFSVKERYLNAAMFLRDIETKAFVTGDIGPEELVNQAQSLCGMRKYDQALVLLGKAAGTKTKSPVGLVKAWVLAQRNYPGDREAAERRCSEALARSRSVQSLEWAAKVYSCLEKEGFAAPLREEAKRK